MGDRLIPITTQSPSWSAWLLHYRGSKNEMRMLACIRETRPFLVPSEYPPDTTHEDRVTRKTEKAPIAVPERRGIGDGEVDVVADRLFAAEERRGKENTEQKKRRKLYRKHEGELEAALEAARLNQRPKVDQNNNLGVLMVEDPNETQRLVRVGKGPPMRVRTKAKPRYRVVSLRDDPIGVMAKRKWLGENGDELLLGAREWQKNREIATLGHGRGANSFRDVVQVSAWADLDIEKITEANIKLARVRSAIGMLPELGVLGVRLVEWVLADRLSLQQVAEIHFLRSPRQLGLGKHLIRCLEITSVVLGVAPDAKIKRGPRRPRDDFDKQAASVDRFNSVLASAVHRATRLRDSGRG